MSAFPAPCRAESDEAPIRLDEVIEIAMALLGYTREVAEAEAEVRAACADLGYEVTQVGHA